MRHDAYDAYDVDAAIGLPPSQPPPASALEHARRMLQRAERGRQINEARLSSAARGNHWEQASNHAARAMAAERAVLRWSAEIVRQQNSRGIYRFDDDDAIDAAAPATNWTGMSRERAARALAIVERAQQRYDRAALAARDGGGGINQRMRNATTQMLRAGRMERIADRLRSVLQRPAYR